MRFSNLGFLQNSYGGSFNWLEMVRIHPRVVEFNVHLPDGRRCVAGAELDQAYRNAHYCVTFSNYRPDALREKIWNAEPGHQLFGVG
jgi:hypothetical protein